MLVMAALKLKWINPWQTSPTFLVIKGIILRALGASRILQLQRQRDFLSLVFVFW